MAEYEPIFSRLETAAKRLGVSREWLKNAAYEGEVPCVRLGRFLQFNIADVEQVLRERGKQAACELRQMLDGKRDSGK